MAQPELRTAQVSKVFGRQRALVDVSVTFSPASISAVIGPNGAGKTTLLGILSTLVKPSRGDVFLGDEPMRASSRASCRRRIGYVGHEPGVYPDLSASQNLSLFASLYDLGDSDERVRSMLQRVGLGEVRADLPARAYSRGMLQRLALARALLHEPDVLLFDEPASALDPIGARWLSDELLRERDAGRLVILVTHDLDVAARVADHVVLIRRGRVAVDRARPGAGAPAFSPSEMRDLYEEAMREP